MKRTIDLEYTFGDVVFLAYRQKEWPGMITGIHLSPQFTPFYIVSWCDGQTQSSHWGYELDDAYIPRLSPNEPHEDEADDDSSHA